jgi:hypothetical protein
MGDIFKYANDSANIILIGNKCDMFEMKVPPVVIIFYLPLSSWLLFDIILTLYSGGRQCERQGAG